MCRKEPRAKQFFLFNDVLVYGRIVKTNELFDNQRIIPLQDVVVETLPDAAETRNGWLLKTKQKSFALFASSETEKEYWMKYIEKCVQDLLTKEKKPPAMDHAPVWIPDNEKEQCMLCPKNFTLLVRRHHCRKCGILVCQSCSSRRLTLTSSKDSVRVCDSCHVVEMNAGRGIMMTFENAGKHSLSNNMKDDLTKTATSAASALASTRPWTATFYKNEAAMQLNNQTVAEVEQNAKAQLAQMIYNELISETDEETGRNQAASYPTTQIGGIHILAVAAWQSTGMTPALTSAEKEMIMNDPQLATQVKELERNILLKKGATNDVKITASELLDRQEEVKEISKSFGSRMIAVHGIHMIHHIIHILIMILFKLL
uniref:Uncharacterized protein n=1 Tax=Plectus sambesii TaxID=2011161 RepID=A0A914XC75_9BILA